MWSVSVLVFGKVAAPLEVVKRVAPNTVDLVSFDTVWVHPVDDSYGVLRGWSVGQKVDWRLYLLDRRI